MDIMAWDNKKRKWVKAGQIVGTTFHKKVNKGHYCWKHEGWGISESVFLKAFETVAIESTDPYYPGKYQSKTDQWVIKDDLTHGPQRFLAVEKMHKLGE